MDYTCRIDTFYGGLLGYRAYRSHLLRAPSRNGRSVPVINSQNIAKTKQGSEEQEIVSTISIAVSSIVTTLIIVIGLIPLAIFQEEIVDVLMPISPYVIPAVFGGLTIALMAKYYKIALIPFAVCIIVCVVGNLIGFEEVNSQSTMVIVGMVISIISTLIMYKLGKV